MSSQEPTSSDVTGQQENTARPRVSSSTATPSPRHWLNRTVVGAGVTSAFGDLCYETTTVLLPGFLAVLGLPAGVLGTIEGIADAIASFTKMVSGYIADKLGHRKLLVLTGYGMTPLGQILLALATGWPLLLLGRAISWAKGFGGRCGMRSSSRPSRRKPRGGPSDSIGLPIR